MIIFLFNFDFSPPDIRLLTKDSKPDANIASLVSQDAVNLRTVLQQDDIEMKNKAGKMDSHISEKELIESVTDDLSTMTFGKSMMKERLEQLAKIAASVDSEMKVKPENHQPSLTDDESLDRKSANDEDRNSSCHEDDADGTVEETNLKSANKHAVDETETMADQVLPQVSLHHVHNDQTDRPDMTIAHADNMGNIVVMETNTQKAQTVLPESKPGQVAPSPQVLPESKSGQVTPSPQRERDGEKKKQKKSKGKQKPAKTSPVSYLKLVEVTLMEWKTENTIQFLWGDKSSTVTEDADQSNRAQSQTPTEMEAKLNRREELDSDDDPEPGQS